MEEIGRQIFWNVGGGARWISYALMVATFIALIYGIKKRYAMWKIGKPTTFKFTDRLGERIGYFIANGIFHKSILREAYPGWMHFFIFWGFLILAIATALIAIQDDVIRLIFGVEFIKGDFYLVFSFLTDLAGAIAIIGILMAIWRRYVVKPTRLDNKPDDLIVLLWILAVLVTGFLVEGARIAADPKPYEVWSFIGWITSSIFPAAEKGTTYIPHAVFWYIHMILSFGLIVYIAYSRLLHIITSSLNMMFRGVEDSPRGAIAPIEDFENAEEFGVNSIEGFTWRQIFDLDACTRCGRCQDLCPAYNSEKPLSPKQFIQDLKAEWERTAQGQKNEDGLIDTVIQEETLWSCTACLACQVNCPVSIPTFDKNIEMRRYLTLTLSKTTSETRLLFKNLQQKVDPYGMGKRQRTEWIEGLDIKMIGEEEVEYLYWVGCVASLDDRNRKVAKAFSKILNTAGVSFGILGQEETCCGDPARRCGNEDLYLGIAQGNVELLKEMGIKKIITTCPHCYHTLKNEYPQVGGNFEVYHQSEFIWKLINEGKLKINPAIEGTITFHDPCYLGRVNRIFDEPRNVVAKAKQGSYVEMGRNHDRSFCCGGGGGRIWMEEHHKRINHLRIDEAIAVSANTVVTACPYCLIMMEDAIKDKEKTETMKALDLSEIVVKGL
ncbi:MAG TPA: heterodisulfide reductase-related iron-sulfur binding cluster [Syntrophorhabdaceae bacterium]|nr:heterodisulfide reductase-related iron-sulfur binding cluster [Syntrophorhabdaceae bacterium]HOT42886.1 heterodisulfide reductase-related iron-sulfur binding cluster [Syntrophorhabdaceae bacterium]HPC67598.1 heterodisulfide reductase-related iron-sulfur binding cluster [Syntrophorhabdaceae bacterium]HQE80964.1 heterodisulfide reductase-related iron-sulfur binding cluster [Syntrophorhabdaceae bacterium]HQH44111.1 heterodisulfide reductase-related iron-sulfur binding cluster [Syntrophorhabdace